MDEQSDPVLPMRQGCGQVIGDNFPVLHCRRGVLDRALQATLGADLARLEQQIDQGPAPHSGELTGWRIAGRVDVRSTPVELKNVVAVLEPKDPAAQEAILIGAHYDHLGYRTQRDVILHGADDNASGTAVLMEVARSLAQRPQRLPRRIVFVAFTAEEIGCVGSGEYTQHPLVPLEQTVAMLNLDMVGRLRNNRLTVCGSSTGKQFGPLLDRLAEAEGLKVDRPPRGEAWGDTFYVYPRGVPVISFFTGMHAHYHWPSDKLQTLNVTGMRQVARFVERVVVELATATTRPEYVKVQ
jgi:Zn-dependent M28 family amino/carboxypeptidase